MAYGGTALGPVAPSGGPTIRQVKLDKECELRVEVADASFRLRLVVGLEEIFGTEIPHDIWLNFPTRLKFAVFRWHGATIEMDGATETDYTLDETPMISYVNVHAVLEARRSRAKASSDDSDASQDALDPHMNQEMLEYHWGKHHKTYVENLNKQIVGTELEEMALEDIILTTYNKGNLLPPFNNAAQLNQRQFFAG